MPIKPRSSETEQEFIGRCMSEEKESFPDEKQRYAVCKSYWDKQEFQEEVYVLKPKKSENRGNYITRCSSNRKMKEQYPKMKERLFNCLNAFNSYYKYWAKLEEFGEIPKDSALGECITKERASGKDYRTAYASCSTKVVSPNTTVVLSDDDDDLLIEPVWT
jgi:hypothetical protein